MRRLLTFAVLLGSCGPRDAPAEAAPSVAPPSARALDGTPFDPLAGDADIVALVFVTPDCPVSNRYAPELRRIATTTPAERVAWWLVYPDPDVDAAQIDAHRQEYALPMPALRDPEHVLVATAGVKVTPEVALFHRSGATMALAYRGRIDDRVPEFGRARPEPTERELVDALAALRQGRTPGKASAAAVGCPIDDLR